MPSPAKSQPTPVRNGAIVVLLVMVVLFFDGERFLLLLPSLLAAVVWCGLLVGFRRVLPAAQRGAGEDLRESLLMGTRRLTLTLTILAAALFLASFIAREIQPAAASTPSTLILSWITAALTVAVGIAIELTGYLHQLHYLSLARLWEKARSGDASTGSLADFEFHRKMVERSEAVGFVLLALQPLSFLASIAYLIAYGCN